MDSPKNIKAVFSKDTHFIYVIVQGNGKVEETVLAGRGVYEYGSVVELKAVPDDGWLFSHWELDATGTTNPLVVYVDKSRQVRAVFKESSLRVPEQYKTIQAAINAAGPGYEIVVSPGTYNENLDLTGKKNITIRGTNPDDPLTILATVIDEDKKGPCILIDQYADVTISGLTLTNGSGVPMSGDYAYGGGFYLGQYSKAVISNCAITGNTGSHGAGIYSNNSTLTLTDTLISDNYASFTGAGIWMSNGQGANTISNCTIINNEASYGGGMYISFSSVSITDNDIGGNTAAIGGAAMFATSANITFVDNNVTNNSSTTSDGVVSIAQSVKVKDKDGNEMTTEEEILAVNDFSDNTPGGVQFTES